MVHMWNGNGVKREKKERKKQRNKETKKEIEKQNEQLGAVLMACWLLAGEPDNQNPQLKQTKNGCNKRARFLPSVHFALFSSPKKLAFLMDNSW